MKSLSLGFSLLFITCVIWPMIWAEEARQEVSPLEKAGQLEREGKEKEAFLKYLTVPGAEYLAVRLARPKAQEYLEVLQEHRNDCLERPAKLVGADLLLMLGRKDEALEAYRNLATSMGKTPEDNSEKGFIPRDYYFVEPPPKSMPSRPRRAPQPFVVGPGSHLDNWLIRRFIALDAMKDAEREFARIWEIHRANSRPYVFTLPRRQSLEEGAGKTISQKHLTASHGFDGKALQFALDYAYFLKRVGKESNSLAILMEPLRLIDMDRNPSVLDYIGAKVVPDQEASRYPERDLTEARWRFWPGYSSAGISRKEFIRLAYGAFKEAGKANGLVNDLKKQMRLTADPKASLRAYRLLSRICLHQGDTEEALRLEVEYIKKAGFDAISTAYRRGLIYEDFRKNAEAAAEYEKVFSLPYNHPDLPDPDEEAIEGRNTGSMGRMDPRIKAERGRERVHRDIIKRLIRLYSALGQNDKVLEVTLRQIELEPRYLEYLPTLEDTIRRFRAAGKEERFKEWVANNADMERPATRATLAWVAGDYETAAESLAKLATPKDRNEYWFEGWKQRFREKGRDKLLLLLKAVVEAHPDDALTRLELLSLEGRLGGPKSTEALELLLNVEDIEALGRAKKEHIYLQLRNHFDLAYRLMRLYEGNGDDHELQTLGMRIAKGERPFGKWWERDGLDVRYRDENQWPEDLNGCLALLIQKADKQTLQELQKIWEELDDFPAKRQLERRLTGGWKQITAKPFGWANLPKGVAALACNENVLSLTCDEVHIYAGMPWGVAVYTHEGEPVTRVAIADAALDLAVQGNNLWIAVPSGIKRITIGSWEVAFLPLDRGITKRQAARTGAFAVAVDHDDVWIGSLYTISRLNTKANALRIFSTNELGIRSAADWDRFIFDDEYVWAGSRGGWLRYDKEKDTWTTLKCNDRTVNLIGTVDGILWGEVYLGNEIRARPCIVDRETLEITPILIEGDLTRSQRSISGPFTYFGKWNGKPVLGAGRASFYYDEGIRKLRPLPKGEESRLVSYEKELLPGLRSGNIWRRPDGSLTCVNDITHYHTLLSSTDFQTGLWHIVALPGGSLVLGARRNRCPRYLYSSEDRPNAYETWDDEGGLFLISPDMSVSRISSLPASDALPGDMALSFLPEDEGISWVGTNRGLAAISTDNEVLSRFSRRDGLCANRVTGAVCDGSLYYFGTAWGDQGGGLAVYDPKTAVFTSFVRSDGLATDKIAGIEIDAGKLRITYDLERGYGSDYRYRLFPRGTFNPDAGKFSPIGSPQLMENDNQAREAEIRIHGDKKTADVMSYLGGRILSRREFSVRTYLCGTRGMVILDNKEFTVWPSFDEIQVKVVLDPDFVFLADAYKVKTSVRSPADLRKYLESPNPYVRAKALASIYIKVTKGANEYTPLILESVKDSHHRVRTTCVALFSRSKDPAIIETLESLLDDEDPSIRATAAASMARLGRLPDLRYFEEMFEDEFRHRGFVIGLELGFGTGTDKEGTYGALAPHANRDIFGLMLQYPLATDNYEPRLGILKELGSSLSKRPDAAEVLLHAYKPEQIRFATVVMGYAGRAILPELHEALQSKDRVIRSNAARGCGAIGDPSSIPHLITALDLESGLSRASIVWALGELKAEGALPRLAEIYIDARNDEKRRRGAGYRSAQARAEISSYYASLRNLDEIGRDWDELKVAAQPEPVDPRRNEELLEPKHVLEAVAKIGPGAAQRFYRAVAGEKETEARREAAIHLAEGGSGDTEKNLPILRSMLGDSDILVRTNAAASLLVLGYDEDIATSILLESLSSDENKVPYLTMKQLERVEDLRKLAAFRKSLTALEKTHRSAYGDSPFLRLARKLLGRTR